MAGAAKEIAIKSGIERMRPTVYGFQLQRGVAIGQAAPDVAPVVAIGIYRMGQVGGGQELRLPHGAGPGADCLRTLDVAALLDRPGSLEGRRQRSARQRSTGQGKQVGSPGVCAAQFFAPAADRPFLTLKGGPP
jgi:hypothetical protein